MPKAIIFDLGDTVLEERSYNIAAGYDVISKYLCPSATLEELMMATAKNQTGNSEFKLLEWINSRLLNPHGLVTAQDVEIKLWKETVSLALKPDIKRALDFLVDKNIRIAAISNAIFSSSCMKVELAKHNIDKYFEFIISSADYGIRKPGIEIFELALSTLKIKPQSTWYIGDNWEADIIGSTSANMTAVWFKEHFHNHDINIDHIKLKNWSEFEDIWEQYAKQDSQQVSRDCGGR